MQRKPTFLTSISILIACVSVIGCSPSAGTSTLPSQAQLASAGAADQQEVNVPTHLARARLLGDEMTKNIMRFANNEVQVNDNLAIILTVGLSAKAYGLPSNGPASEIKSVDVKNIESGFVELRQHKLPAAIITYEVKTINRSEGKYGSICLIHASIIDDEFSVYRDSIYESCEDPEGMERVEGWKKNHPFLS